MSSEEENNLTLDIIKFGMKNEPFTLGQLKEAIKPDNETENYILTHLVNFNYQSSPNHILTTVGKYNNTFPILQILREFDVKFRVLPSAAFSYIDHLEIVEARKAAKESKRLSWIAIWISTGIGLASLVVGLIQILK
ncbi:MAG: hypothetical protein U0U09_14275 [Cyclobacteriaceae bacterium]